MFLAGKYEPLPTIVESAKLIMRDEPLPQIKALKSSNYDHVMEEITSIDEEVKRNQRHFLIVVSVVPEDCYTFVRFYLAHTIDDAVDLSGNGPLVDVLDDSFQNNTFVQVLFNYKNDYEKHVPIPNDN